MKRSASITRIILCLTGTGALLWHTVTAASGGQWEADFELDFAAYLNAVDGVEKTLLSGSLLVENSWEPVSSRWALHGKVRLQADSENYTDGTALFIDDGLRRPYFSIDEAYLQVIVDSWEFRAGNQYYTDGESEFYSLVDQINARDLLDLPNNRKLPSLSLSGFHYADSGVLRAVIVPVFTPSRLPTEGDRWFPDLPAMEGGPPPSILGRNLPGHTLDNLQAGLQWKSSHILPGGDIALQVFHGIDPIGVYAIQPGPNSLDLLQVYPRYTEWSASFQLVQERVSYYGEAAFHDTENNAADDDYVETLFGVSIDITDYAPDWVDFGHVFIEYAGETTVDPAKPGSGSGFLPTRQFTRPLQNSVILGIRAEQFLRFEFNSGIVCNLDDNDWLLQTGLRYRTRSGFWLNLDATFLNGSRESFFGRWRENDRLSVSVDYTY